MFSYQVETSTI